MPHSFSKEKPTTLAPMARNRLATASPIPLAAPLTSATRPCICNSDIAVFSLPIQQRLHTDDVFASVATQSFPHFRFLFPGKSIHLLSASFMKVQAPRSQTACLDVCFSAVHILLICTAFLMLCDYGHTPCNSRSCNHRHNPLPLPYPCPMHSRYWRCVCIAALHIYFLRTKGYPFYWHRSPPA